jgi:hypothetical protein
MKTCTPEAIEAAVEMLRTAMTQPEGGADVFVQWSPHCSLIQATFHSRGYDVCDNTDQKVEFYTDARMGQSYPSGPALVKFREHIANCRQLSEGEKLRLKSDRLRKEAADYLAASAQIEQQLATMGSAP